MLRYVWHVLGRDNLYHIILLMCKKQNNGLCSVQVKLSLLLINFPKTEYHLNKTQSLHYKDKLVNAIYADNGSCLWDGLETN
jgi:hypothetical protein